MTTATLPRTATDTLPLTLSSAEPATSLRGIYHPDVYETFRENTQKHELTVIHDVDGYQHLRFAEPGTGMYRFDLIVWPGHLTIVGDIGAGFTFRSPGDNMLSFFGTTRGRGYIKPRYWSEKLVGASHMKIEEFSPKRFAGQLIEHAEQRAERLSIENASKLNMAVDSYLRTDPPQSYEDFESFWSTFRYNDQNGDSHSFSDAYEWSVSDFTFTYAMACHAILAGAQMYLATKAAET